MKAYRGFRTPHACVVMVGETTATSVPLDPRNDLHNHSPNGFEWGYEGSGPAQLALAILAHWYGDDEKAVRQHQIFKRQVIGKLPRKENWVIDEKGMRAWAVGALLDDIEKRGVGR